MTAQQDTELVELSTTTYIPPSVHTDNFNQIFEDPMFLTILGNAVTYISGWIARKLVSKLTCPQCKFALVDSHRSLKFVDYLCLLEVKNRGGLLRPSDGLIKIVMLAEKYLRTSKKLSMLDMQIHILAEVGFQDVLNLQEHIQETSEGINNHGISLVKLIIETYYNLRKHHDAKILNFELHKTLVRHRNSKATIFMGQ